MASPAMHPIRPGIVDPRRPGEYPIILGDSLRNDAKSNKFINIRYNWQPKSGFQSRDSQLTESGDKYSLVVRADDSDDDGGEYQYRGTLQPASSSGKSEETSTSLALVFDKSRSVFVLESLSASLDLNLKCGPGQPARDARELPQLSFDRQSSKQTTQANGDSSAPPSPDDEGPDPSNPYDFRNFLAEARENIDKSSQQQQQGNRTPNPGGMTPLSGVSTPVPGSSRFKPTTPQFRPTTKPISKTGRSSDAPRARASSGASKTTSKRDNAAASTTKSSTQQPLSKARITDSDDDSDDDSTSLAVSRGQNKPSTSTTKSTKPARPARKTAQHSRNISSTNDASPHIIINDDDGDLEIDMGSPPPEDRARRTRVDPEMFRSHTGTPIAGSSSNNTARPSSSSTRPLSRLNGTDNAHDRSGTRDRDVKMKDIEADSSDDEDGDVEEFELGSPQEKQSGPVQQQQQQRQNPAPPPASTAPATTAQAAEDEDDEGFLEAALEAAFGEEDEQAGQHGGVGLGIGMTHAQQQQQQQQDDESEVSEEE